eukprot:3268846-Amphidinium_carterae.1
MAMLGMVVLIGVKRKVFTMQIYFKDRDLQELPALPQRPGATQLAFHGGGSFCLLYTSDAADDTPC